MPTPTTLGPTDVSLDGVANSVRNTYQRKAFFAERRHWVFYVDDAGVLLYDSSVRDSGVWLGPQPLALAASGAEFSVFVQESPPTSASYVHLVYSPATGGPIFYIRGTLALNGTIAWDAPDEAVAWDAGWRYENLGITMDFSGKLYVVYVKAEIAGPGQRTPYVCQSTTADGTWTDGAGYPFQLTAVNGGWIPLISAYWREVMVVYSEANGNIYSRLLSGGVWGAQVDTGSDIGGDAQAISIVSETRIMGLNGSQGPVGSAVYVAFQAADWDLYSITYDSGAPGWGAANTIQVIGAFRSANPMLAVLDQGDSDNDHLLGTVYCFWTPTADAPTPEWVTYRLSRDQGATWTDEDGVDAAEEWIDETGDGFEIQASGSAYSFSDPDYYGQFYIGLVYVVHRMPPAIRHAALSFEDPAVDLYCYFGIAGTAGSVDLAAEFIIRQTAATLNLLGEFIVRQPGTADLLGEFNIGARADSEDLFAEFFVNQGALDLLAEFNVQQAAAQDLPAEVFVTRVGTPANLLGEFIVQQEDSEDLLGEFEAQQEASEDLKAFFRTDVLRASKGLNVSVYEEMGIVV